MGSRLTYNACYNGCLQCKIYKTFIIINLHKKLHKIIKLMMSWLVAVSQLFINNISNNEMTNVSR
jgi:hypothetical protein